MQHISRLILVAVCLIRFERKILGKFFIKDKIVERKLYLSINLRAIQLFRWWETCGNL